MMPLFFTEKRKIAEIAQAAAYKGKDTAGKADARKPSGSGDGTSKEGPSPDAHIEDTGIDGHGHRRRTDRKVADNF